MSLYPHKNYIFTKPGACLAVGVGFLSHKMALMPAMAVNQHIQGCPCNRHLPWPEPALQDTPGPDARE